MYWNILADGIFGTKTFLTTLHWNVLPDCRYHPGITPSESLFRTDIWKEDARRGDGRKEGEKGASAGRKRARMEVNEGRPLRKEGRKEGYQDKEGGKGIKEGRLEGWKEGRTL